MDWWLTQKKVTTRPGTYSGTHLNTHLETRLERLNPARAQAHNLFV